MRWPKSKKWTVIGVVAGILLLVVGGLAAVLKHEPGFYRRAAVAPGPERVMLSTACFGRLVDLINCIKDHTGKWEVKISQGQLNSYFAEDFIRLRDAEGLRRHGISDPRVAIEGDRLRIGFRYGSGFWSTIISYDLRLWLAPKEGNVVCVEIVSRQAGGLPIATQTFLKEISDVAKKNNIDVTWYRHNGNPVAMLRFQADRTRSTFQLQRLDVRDGMIAIAGISHEPAQAAASVNPPPEG